MDETTCKFCREQFYKAHCSKCSRIGISKKGLLNVTPICEWCFAQDPLFFKKKGVALITRSCPHCNKKQLLETLDKCLKPLGFRRKGNYWELELKEIYKVIYLQKSNFSNAYYLNYGFIIKKLELGEERMHIHKGLGSPVKKEMIEINNMFDLDYSISDSKREKSITSYTIKYVVNDIESVNDEKQIFDYLMKEPNLNNISLNVKKYFKLI